MSNFKTLKVFFTLLLTVFSLSSCGIPPFDKKPNQTKRWQAPVSYESFTVRSTPSKANVRFSTGETCKTPCTVKRNIEQDFSVTLSKEGYKSKTIHVVSIETRNHKTGLKPNPVDTRLELSWEKK